MSDISDVYIKMEDVLEIVDARIAEMEEELEKLQEETKKVINKVEICQALLERDRQMRQDIRYTLSYPIEEGEQNER